MIKRKTINKHPELSCPKCGGPVTIKSMTFGQNGATGKQRWACATNRSESKIYCWSGTAPIGIEKLKSKGIDESVSKGLKQLVLDKKIHKFVITAAQNATPIKKSFMEALVKYCDINTAQLIVIPYRYKNPTSMWSKKAKDDDWWAEKLTPYILEHRVKINSNLILLADIKTQPTASNPLEGFETLSGGLSAIIGHPKLELLTVPAPANRMAKILTTTGSVTERNYIPSKAGKKGEFHHTFAAVVIEVKGKKFHLRQLVATDDGAFIDLQHEYTGKGRRLVPVAGMVMGDTHVEFADPDVVKATLTNKSSMLNILKPKYVVWHDVYDCYARNHHEKNDVFVNLVKHRTGRGSVEAGLNQTFKFVDENTKQKQTNIFVPSNHPNEHLLRWVNETDPRNDLENCVFWAQTFVALANSSRMTNSGVKFSDPFYYWAKRKLRTADQSIFLEIDQGFRIQGIEVGFHGHQGSNGSRGSRRQFGKIGARTVIGHSHSPGIRDGVYQVGTSSRLRLSYNHGPSSWMHTHCLIYQNGKRSLINIVDGEWRLL
jgi:hypothetical protein